MITVSLQKVREVVVAISQPLTALTWISEAKVSPDATAV